MTRQFSIPVFSILILAGGIFGYGRYRQTLNQPKEIFKQAVKLTVEIPEVVNDLIPLRYTCEGDGVSPKIKIAGVPEQAKSLVLIVDDKDATIGIFTHWLMWNLDPETKLIKEGETPVEATVGKNGYGNFEWGSICPAAGRTHRYSFKIYALDDNLDLLVEETKQTDLIKAVKGKTIGYGETTALFGK